MSRPEPHGAAALHPFFAEILPSGQARLTLKAAWGSDHVQYTATLLHILKRLRRADGILVDASVESRETRALPKARRRLKIRGRSLPVRLRDESDLDDLRSAIQAAQAAVKVQPGTSGGNPTRRLEMVVAGSDGRGPRSNLMEYLVAGRSFASRSAAPGGGALVLAGAVPYRREASLPPTRERRSFDANPDLQERGAAAHARTQNAAADVLRRYGLTPLSGRGPGGSYDLAWEWNGALSLAEVKSLTAANSERQLRLGLGQVLRYRDLAAAEGSAAVAWLVVERPPADEGWRRLCESLEVRLAWPASFEARLLDDLRSGLAVRKTARAR